jgi:hypothetical protein
MTPPNETNVAQAETTAEKLADYNARLRERIGRSRRAAITLFCRECVGVGDGGTARDIRECSSKDCALYQVRPYQAVTP